MSDLAHYTLSAGDIIADRYEVETCMGTSELGPTCLVLDRKSDKKFLLKQLSFQLNEQRIAEITSIVAHLKTLTHKSIAELEEFIVDDGIGYICTEFIEGESFEAHLAMRRERGQVLGLKAAYSFLAHLCSGVDIMHQSGYYYGALSPSTIYVTRQGRVKVANTVFPILADRYLEPAKRDAYFSSAFTAVEVQSEPGMASAESDVYSLALLFAELLSALSLTGFGGTPESFITRLGGISSALKDALYRSVKQDRSLRFSDILSFKETLKNAVDAPSDNDLSSIVVGMNDLRALTVSADFPVVGAPPKKPDLFDRSDNIANKTASRSNDAELWIYQMAGLDYGPFNSEGLLKKLYSNDIDETTSVLNIATKKRELLGRIPEFAEAVKSYIPIRERNHAEMRAQKKRKEKRAKTAGISTIVLGILGVAAFIGIPAIILMSLADPEPLNFRGAFAPFEKRFELPKMTEFSLNVDDKQAQALFDPKASAAEREAALAAWEEEHRKKYASRRRTAGMTGSTGTGSPEDGIETLSFYGDDGAELTTLYDWEIEEQLMNPRALRKQSDCFVQYAGGRSHNISVNFVIQQSGSVRNLTTTATGELNDCLVSAFSSLKFRQFGGTVKKVSYPLQYK